MNKLKSGKAAKQEKKSSPKTVQDWKREKEVKEMEEKSGYVTLKHSTHKPKKLNLAGKKVKEAAKIAKDLFNLKGDEDILVNSEKVGPNHVLKEGDVVEFVKESSQKGYAESLNPGTRNLRFQYRASV